MWLLAGLGNPGPRYHGTRHNVGFAVVDAIAEKYGFPAFTRKFKSLASHGTISAAPVLLLKPQTYMNLSGEAVQAAAAFYKIDVAHIVAIHDELDFPVAEVRLKRGGGMGGHNGLKSMEVQLGTADFLRMRIGIDKNREATDHVLSPFLPDEAEKIEKAVTYIRDHITELLSQFETENFQNKKVQTGT